MKIFICEDEVEISLALKSICEATLHQLKLDPSTIETYNDATLLAQNYHLGKRADLLLLDIELGSHSGIDVARKIRQLDKAVKIVFVTNYKDYKDDAFSVHAFGYIQKPFQPEKISSIISECIQYTVYNEKNLLKFKGVNGDFLINKNDVLYIENQNRKQTLVCFSDIYPLIGKISTLTDELEQFNFYRPHVSFLINLDYVRQIKGYTIYMVNQDEIPLSQKRASMFRKKMNQHLQHIVHTYKEDNI